MHTLYQFVLILLGVYCCNHVALGNIFQDPYVPTQDWIFQMINVYPVWEQGYTGNGIHVRVNDNGVDASHVEFQGRFDVDASCKLYEARYDKDTQEFDTHGTKVASILGGAGNNGQCSTGIAPSVNISSCIVIGDEPDTTSFENTVLAYKYQNVDISQNAYGFYQCIRGRYFTGKFTEKTCPFTHFYNETIFLGDLYDFAHPCDECEFPTSSDQVSSSCSRAIRRYCQYHFFADRDLCVDYIPELALGGQCTFLGQFENTTKSLEIGATQGRNGKGIIYVFSAGNGNVGDTNFDGRFQSRYVLLIGSVGRDTIQAQYSRGGASLFVVAPAGDIESDGTQTVAQAGGGCVDAGVGTSFSSATVSGVIALMLEANPELSWRDIQGILATTSQSKLHTDIVDETQTINGAGIFHSNSHGFGVIDAMAAVAAAKTWESYGAEQHITISDLDLNLHIGDDPKIPAFTEFTVESSGIIVENIMVSLYLKHLSRGHLKILLTSPNGTVSMLTPGARPENGQLLEDEAWELRTVKSWGETAEGTWKLSIVDTEEGDVSNCVDFANYSVPFLNSTFNCAFLELFPGYYREEFPILLSQLYDDGAVEKCCACGGGTTAQGNCFDADGFQELCNSTEILEVCVNGTLLPQYAAFQIEDESGRNAREACCLFGGGITIEDTASFQDLLTGWTLDIYGHIPETTPSPTMMDSDSPSLKPSPSPSVSPTNEPITLTRVPTALAEPTGAPGDSPPSAPLEPTTAPGDSSSSAPSLLHCAIATVSIAMIFLAT